MTSKIYFFKKDMYVQIDAATKTVDPGYPRRIADDWTGLAAVDDFASGFDDAAYLYAVDPDSVFFFKNGNYLQYNFRTNTAGTRTWPLSNLFQEIPEEFQSGFDACAMYKGYFYLFKQSDEVNCWPAIGYRSFSGVQNAASDYRWPQDFEGSVDAGLTCFSFSDASGIGSVASTHFFKQSHAYEYGGGEQPINEYIKNLNDDFASEINAAVHLPVEKKISSVPVPNPSGDSATFTLPANTKFWVESMWNRGAGQQVKLTLNSVPLDVLSLPNGSNHQQTAYTTGASPATSSLGISISVAGKAEPVQQQTTQAGKTSCGIVAAEGAPDLDDVVVVIIWPVV